MLCLIYQAGYMARDRQSRNRRAAKSIFSGGVFWVFLLNAFRERSTCPRAPSRAKRTVIFGAILVSSSQVARGGRRGTRARWASARASHARPPGRTRRWVEGRDRSALSVFSFSDERPVSGHIRDTVTFRKSLDQSKALHLHICRAFLKPTRGLEPRTPSLRAKWPPTAFSLLISTFGEAQRGFYRNVTATGFGCREGAGARPKRA